MLFTDSITVDGTPELLWALTTDVEALPSITPTMSEVERLDEGPLAVGSRVRIEQPGMRSNVWTVRRLDEPHLLEWDTKVGTVVITARHLITATDGGATNRLEVELSGFGSGLVGRLLGGRLNEGLAQENAGFAAAVARSS
ncbi:MAG: SRPBCC family protein [Actinomycetota bacterium]